jgi:hypothetical protein
VAVASAVGLPIGYSARSSPLSENLRIRPSMLNDGDSSPALEIPDRANPEHSPKRDARALFLLSEPARVEMLILRRLANGRYSLQEHRTLAARAGLSQVRVSGWFRERGLPSGRLRHLTPGTYVARLAAVTENEVIAGDLRKNLLSARFRVVP